MLLNYRQSTMDMIFRTILEKSQEKIDIEIAPQSICTIGRIEENKGSDRVVEVIRLLHQEGKNYHLYFMGLVIWKRN